MKNYNKLDFVNHKRGSSNFHYYDPMKLSELLFLKFTEKHPEVRTFSDYFSRLTYDNFCKNDALDIMLDFIPYSKSIKHTESNTRVYLYGKTFQNVYKIFYDDGNWGTFVFNINFFKQDLVRN